MIRKNISFGIIRAVIAGSVLVLSGCNALEEGFYVADRADLTMTIIPESPNVSDRSISEIPAVNGRDRIFVATRAPWKVELMLDNREETEQDWTLSIDEIVNAGEDSYFTYSSSTNFGKQRDWINAFKIYIENIDGEQLLPTYVSVRQGVNTLIPMPTSFETFPPAGRTDNVINIEANGGWNVSCDQENTPEHPLGWVEIVRPATMSGNGILRFNVLANRGTSERTATIAFADPGGKAVAEITLRQTEADALFDVGPNSSLEYTALAKGDTLRLNVLSDGEWKVDCAQAGSGGWLRFVQPVLGTPQAGNGGSGTGTDLTLVAAANSSLNERTALLNFSRTAEDIRPIKVTVRQSGALEVEKTCALSIPWIEGSYTQDYVFVCARYEANHNPDEIGIAFRPQGYTQWAFVQNMTGVEGGSQDSRIAVRLTSEGSYGPYVYQGGTAYEVATYARIDDGELIISAPLGFTSPGIESSGAIPDPDDQTPPSL